MDAIRDYVHWILDSALGYMKLLQSREVGWLTVVRKTGKFKREQQPILKKIKLLLLFNPLTEWVDRTHLFRLLTHDQNFYAGTSIRGCWMSYELTTSQRRKKYPPDHTSKSMASSTSSTSI